MINFSEVDKPTVAKLFLFHIFIIALSNYLVQFPQEIMGVPFTWAMFTFPLVLVATDLTVRLTNKSNARAVIAMAFIPAILVSAELSTFRIGLASAFAYFIGQLFDVTVFQRIREKFSAWWVAPFASSIFANLVDTYVFFSAAFYKSEDPFMADNWLIIANNDVFFKIIVSLVIILPIYGVVLNYFMNKLKPAQ
jgi:uncharacterized PurR-regulated membrane protein YhhQ (DUF165 family)